MGIFSFGKKDDAPTRRGANTSTRAARSERVERRTRRTERTVDADAMLLDPTLPEKQRARRRLVGAIALVVAAVVVLPMVLDSHPKPVTDDISIDIPSRPAPKLSSKTDEDDTQAGVAPDNPSTPDAAASGLAPAATAGGRIQDSTKQQTADADSAKLAAKPSAPSPSSSKPTAKPQTPVAIVNAAPAAQPSAQTSSKAATTQSATTTPARNGSNASGNNASNNANSSNANSTALTSAAAADADSGTPASPPGSRFAVQLGAFPDDASARTWVNKLKAAGVPAYTERRKQADGVTRTLLRAGPFADRAAASAAIAKVRAAGLGAGANNGATQ